MPHTSDRVVLVIETMLTGATPAGIGEVLGANGGYADRLGRKAMLKQERGRWRRCIRVRQMPAMKAAYLARVRWNEPGNAAGPIRAAIRVTCRHEPF